ncbi:hypothetical protein [Luteolibacter luteus]|uniref:Uncharacterized protein n=1 Tax=Luteolibacter luteus TaxID=2728835 RepID=A0A858RIY2_9BACT|nr:hypothetical protein [Luteolibacter luteus]QJE96867.1 hypothetical protein HHL09_14090 [Luteolibacter luteus]
MNRTLPLLAWLLAMLSAQGMTAAWKVPLEGFVENLEADDRVKKLGTAPGNSAFFQEGDELWDVSAVLKWERRIGEPGDDPFAGGSQRVAAFKWTGDWLVWNARSQLVVASGSWMDLRDAEQALGYWSLPILIRSKFEILGGEEDKLKRSLSLVLRSGERAQARWEGGSLDLEGIAGSTDAIDLRWTYDWPTGEEGQTWSVVSATTLKEGERTLLAAQGQDERRWQLFTTVTIEVIDGTLRSQVRLIEESGRIVSWQPEVRNFEPFLRPLPGGLVLGVFEVFPDFAERLDPEFGKKAALAESPPQAKDWVRGLRVDARPLLAGQGIKIEGEGSFATFDARGYLVVIADAKALDLVTQMTTPLWDPPPPSIRIGANAEAGGWLLTTRSGEKAEIKRSRMGATEALFVIEPILGGQEHLMDVRYTIDAIKGTKVSGRVESQATLEVGKPKAVACFSSDGEEATNLILTGEIDEGS